MQVFSPWFLVLLVSAMMFGSGCETPPDEPPQTKKPVKAKKPKKPKLTKAQMEKLYKKMVGDKDWQSAESAGWRIQEHKECEYLIPRLLKDLDKDFGVRTKISIAACISTLGVGGKYHEDSMATLIKHLKIGSHSLKTQILEQLMNRGPVAFAAAPQIIENIKNTDTSKMGRLNAYHHRSYHYSCFPDICNTAKALPLLTETYASKSPVLRGLAVCGMSHPSALPLLLKTLKDPDAGVRRAAFARIRQVKGHKPEVYKILVPYIETKGEHNEDAVKALAGFGDFAAPLIRDKCLDKSLSLEVRKRYATCFWEMGNPWKKYPKTRKEIGVILEKADQPIQLAVLWGLDKVSPNTEAANESFAIIAPFLNAKSRALRVAIAKFYNRLSASKAETRVKSFELHLPRFLPWFESGDAEEVKLAERAIIVTYSNSKESLAIFMNWLAQPDPKLRLQAARFLWAFAQTMSKADWKKGWREDYLPMKDKLIALLTDKDPKVQKYALKMFLVIADTRFDIRSKVEALKATHPKEADAVLQAWQQLKAKPETKPETKPQTG